MGENERDKVTRMNVLRVHTTYFFNYSFYLTVKIKTSVCNTVISLLCV